MKSFKIVILLVSLLNTYPAICMEDKLSGIEEIQRASKENKHIFIFFYKNKNDSISHSETEFLNSMEKLNGVKSISIDINNPNEKALVEKFKLKRAAVPFVLVMAPNGAITGYFKKFTLPQLKGSIVSTKAAHCLKSLQDNKLVLLCLQNDIKKNKLVSPGVNAFKSDPKYTKATEIVLMDPSDFNEREFLSKLGVSSVASDPVTVLLYPPSVVIGKFTGSVTKEQLVASLKKATEGCKDGNCPGGCN